MFELWTQGFPQERKPPSSSNTCNLTDDLQFLAIRNAEPRSLEPNPPLIRYPHPHRSLRNIPSPSIWRVGKSLGDKFHAETARQRFRRKRRRRTAARNGHHSRRPSALDLQPLEGIDHRRLVPRSGEFPSSSRPVRRLSNTSTPSRGRRGSSRRSIARSFRSRAGAIGDCGVLSRRSRKRRDGSRCR